eukprot:m.53110 g.53110  ORF g.53110 m.53110 type:complete len:1528 (+) comp6444_c0_seq1:1-4584(+)
MFRHVVSRPSTSLFIVPFISVAAEKHAYLADIAAGAGLRVLACMGSRPCSSIRDTNVIVCTIEKANGLINRIMEEKLVDYLSCVVLDELHMISDPGRGSIVELMLTKLRHCFPRTQIVGMSASLPNINRLCAWLGATYYTTSFRPVPLVEHAVVGLEVLDRDFNCVRTLSSGNAKDSNDDAVVQLCTESFRLGHGVLIFLPRKRWCELLARRLASSLGVVQESRPLQDIITSLQAVQSTETALHLVLQSGVAYHHAGLTLEERDIVEQGFKDGHVRILCATTTLSTGINLPARRVLIRSPKVHTGVLDPLMYRQMIGRAGRFGKDSLGESFLICTEAERELGRSLLQGTIREAHSALAETPSADTGNGTDIQRGVLEAVVGAIANTIDGLERYLLGTLLSVEQPTALTRATVQSAVEYLEQHEFIYRRDDVIFCTRLGGATVAANLSPAEARSAHDAIDLARRSLALDSDLHLIYLLTPVNQLGTPLDWGWAYNTWGHLRPPERRIADLVGIEEGFLVLAHTNKLSCDNPVSRRQMAVHQRFFVAYLLHRLVKQEPLRQVSEAVSIDTGVLQAIQQSAATFAGMMTIFCRRLGWQSMELLFDQFQDRMTVGGDRGLSALMQIPAIRAEHARALYAADLQDPIAVAGTAVHTLTDILQQQLPFQTLEGGSVHRLRRLEITARKLILNAKSLLRTPQLPSGLPPVARREKSSPPDLPSSAAKRIALDVGSQDEICMPSPSPSQVAALALQLPVDASSGLVLPPVFASPPPPQSPTAAFLGQKPLPSAIAPVPKSDRPAKSLETVHSEPAQALVQAAAGTPSPHSSPASSPGPAAPKQSPPHTTSQSAQTSTSKRSPSPSPLSSIHKHYQPSPQLSTPPHHSLTGQDSPSLLSPLPSANESIKRWCWPDTPLSAHLLGLAEQAGALRRIIVAGQACDVLSVGSSDELLDLIARDMAGVRAVAFAAVATSGNAPVTEIALCCSVNLVVVVALRASGAARLVAFLQQILGEGAVKLCGPSHIRTLASVGISVNEPIVDLSVTDWLLSPSVRPPSMAAIVSSALGEAARLLREEDAICRAPVEALLAWRIWPDIMSRLSLARLLRPLEDIELGASAALAALETACVLLSRTVCANVSAALIRSMQAIETRAHAAAGGPFAIANSAQVSRVLFETLRLPHPADTAPSSRKMLGSTGRRPMRTRTSLPAGDDVLQQLDHPIAVQILEWRQGNVVLALIRQLVGSHTEERIPVQVVCNTRTLPGYLVMQPALQLLLHPQLSCDYSDVATRSVFCARSGFALVSLCYEHPGLHILSAASADPDVGRACDRPGRELCSLAAAWLAVNPSSVTDSQILDLCAVLRCVVFGGGPPALARARRVPVADAAALLTTFYARFPAIRACTVVQRSSGPASAADPAEGALGIQRTLGDLAKATLGLTQQAVAAIGGRVLFSCGPETLCEIPESSAGTVGQALRDVAATAAARAMAEFWARRGLPSQEYSGGILARVLTWPDEEAMRVPAPLWEWPDCTWTPSVGR